MRGFRSPSLWAAVALAVAAALYVLRVRAYHGVAPANDLYAYFYPKMLYALASLRDGGRGLLWNPYQNCGQPFFGLSQTGLLYPPYLLFLVFEPEWALRAVALVQLVIGGVGAYLLGRELGARLFAALGGALVFEMGNSMLQLTISSPTHSAPFAWIPIIMLCAERLLRAPSPRRAAALAVALGVAILPGMPQTVFFVYQLIGLRVLFELATRRVAHPLPLLGCVGMGLVLPVLLAAVQLFPEIESARGSVRGLPLHASDIQPYASWSVDHLRWLLRLRNMNQPFILVPCMLSLAGVLSAATRRLAAFYGGIAILFFALAFGPGSLVYDVYSVVPGLNAFRMPIRFLWITSFCLAPLTALGIEALTSQVTAPGWRWSAAALLIVAAPCAVLFWLTPNRFVAVEWLAAGFALLATIAAVFAIGGAERWAPPVLVAALATQLVFGPLWSNVYWRPQAPDFFANAALFDSLRRRLGPQDRVYLIDRNTPAFMAKSASLFRIPAVLDYEPLTSLPYARLSVMLRAGVQMPNLNSFIYRGPQLTPNFSRRLLDLTAARYVVASARDVPSLHAITPPLRPIDTIGDVTVFENPQRLPRAFYVPRVEAVADPKALLARLANGTDDLSRVALVAAPPASGFVGDSSVAPAATVRFSRDDPEHVVLEVDAPARGFVVLSDQYALGWSATVDGGARPILRANLAFRLVEVPVGRSTIEFRYSPGALWLGACVSALGSAAIVALLRRTGRQADDALTESPATRSA